MTTAFAAAEARLGRSIRARLGNAQLVIGNAPAVDGIFTDTASIAALGQGAGMQAREFQFVAASAEVGGVANNMPVVVVRPTGPLNLSVVEVTRDPALGMTTLGLQRR